MYNAIIHYFTLLYAGIPEEKFFEIRALPPSRGRAINCFFPVSAKGFQRGLEFCLRMRGDYNLYAGVLPRDTESGNDTDVSASGWLWADIDRGDASHADVLTLFEKAKSLPKPRLVVDTGSGGGHLYWRLSEPLSLATPEEQQTFRSLGKRLAQFIGSANGAHADVCVVNPSRILRIPDTFNHKHAPPKAAQMADTKSEDASPVSWWKTFLPYEREEKPVFQDVRSDRKVFWGGISPNLEAWADRGFPEGQRHRKLLGAAVWLKGLPDLSTDDAQRLFLRKVVASNQGAKTLIDKHEAEGMWGWR